jgi:hypothetical protein
MNAAQNLWWEQAKSDWGLFLQLRRSSAAPCHLLHYVQMATEKLSKAYLWRSGLPPPKSHTGFIRFLKAILVRRPAELAWIAKALEFERPESMQKWATSVQPLAYTLQRMAPAEARNGPNPEYPWPHEAPTHCPATHPFALWEVLSGTGQGRKMIEFIHRAIRRFDAYA